MKKPEKPIEKPTGFGGKSFIDRSSFRQWAKKQPDTWKYYPKLTPDQRAKKIEEEIWGKPTSKWGNYIEKNKREPERRGKELYKESRSPQLRRDPRQRRTKTFNIRLLNRFMGKN